MKNRALGEKSGRSSYLTLPYLTPYQKKKLVSKVRGCPSLLYSVFHSVLALLKARDEKFAARAACDVVSLKMFNMNYEYKERDNRSTAPDFDLRRGAKPVFFGGVVFVAD